MKTVKQVQQALFDLGFYTGVVDDVWGAYTESAVRQFQSTVPPLPINGKISDKLIDLLFFDVPERQKEPKPFSETKSAYPQDSTKALLDFYGAPGENIEIIRLPFKLRIAWDLNKTVSRLSCHRKVASGMSEIFENTLATYGQKAIHELRLDLFGGCLSRPARAIRGGKRLSTHSWGISVDIDPTHNQLRWHKDKAKLAGSDYNDFWDIVEKAGATSLGRARDFDWMHFQFANLRRGRNG